MKQLNFTKKAAREIVLQKKLTSEAELCQMGPYTIVVDWSGENDITSVGLAEY